MNDLPPANNEEEKDEFENYDQASWTNTDKEKKKAEIDAEIARAEKLLEKSAEFKKLDFYQLEFDPDLNKLNDFNLPDWLKYEPTIKKQSFENQDQESPEIIDPLDDQELNQYQEEQKRTKEANRLRDKVDSDFESQIFDRGFRISHVGPTVREEPGRFKLAIIEMGLIESEVDDVEVSVSEYGRLLEKVLMIDKLVDENINFSNVSYTTDEYIGEYSTTKQMIGKVKINKSHPEFDSYLSTIWHLNIIQVVTTSQGKRPGTFDVCLECFITNVQEYNFRF